LQEKHCTNIGVSPFTTFKPKPYYITDLKISGPGPLVHRQLPFVFHSFPTNVKPRPRSDGIPVSSLLLFSLRLSGIYVAAKILGLYGGSRGTVIVTALFISLLLSFGLVPRYGRRLWGWLVGAQTNGHLQTFIACSSKGWCVCVCVFVKSRW
jgi:hypothetical protein